MELSQKTNLSFGKGIDRETLVMDILLVRYQQFVVHSHSINIDSFYSVNNEVKFPVLITLLCAFSGRVSIFQNDSCQ